MKFAHSWILNLPRKRGFHEFIVDSCTVTHNEIEIDRGACGGKGEKWRLPQLQRPLLQRLDYGAKTVAGNPFGHPMVGAKLGPDRYD
jgi:hypothetical protein